MYKNQERYHLKYTLHVISFIVDKEMIYKDLPWTREGTSQYSRWCHVPVWQITSLNPAKYLDSQL